MAQAPARPASRTGRGAVAWHCAALAIWFGAGAAANALFWDAPQPIFLTIEWVLWALFCPILFSAGAAWLRWRARRGSAVLFVSAVVAAAVLWRQGEWAGRLLGFHFERAKYERIVSEIAGEISRGTAPADGVRHGIFCHVELGPPLRVAFVLNGRGDNWIGLVYDPTGNASAINRLKPDLSNRREPRIAAVMTWFGGDMIRSKPLSGAWSICWFT